MHTFIKLLNMYKFNFEKLEVWKKARLFTKDVYLHTRSFPDCERYGIVNQIRRSAISVCSNIAEGSARLSGKDQRHFYNMAYSSLMECFNQLLISQDLEYINMNDSDALRKGVNILSFMPYILRGSNLKNFY